MASWRQDPARDDVPERLHGVLNDVLGDLQGDRPIDVLVGIGPQPDPDARRGGVLLRRELHTRPGSVFEFGALSR